MSFFLSLGGCVSLIFEIGGASLFVVITMGNLYD